LGAFFAVTDSVSLSRELHDQYSLGGSLCLMGSAALAQGHHAQARTCLEESLTISQEINQKDYMFGCFVGLGVLAASQGRPTQAAQLMGASEGLFGQVPFLIAAFRSYYHRQIEDLRPQLHDAAFAAAWAEGRAMTLEQALAVAWQALEAGMVESSVPLSSQGQANQALTEPLTERELEVLRRMADGLTNDEIAAQLVIGISTVKTHINHLFSKLGVKTRTQAVARARALKLL
jgi:DNA-binding CsgD family transcriptional regulator